MAEDSDQDDDSGLRVLVIHNPVAGRRWRRLFRGVRRALDSEGCRVTIRNTTAMGDAERLAREGAREPFDVIAVAGGDGTINEALNGLGPEAPPLALIPLGTANVLAAEIGLARRPRAIVRTLIAGEVRSLQPGIVNGRRFLMMAGTGLDAVVVANIAPGIKRRFGKFAYVLQTLRETARYPFPVLSVTADGEEIRGVTVVACRGRRYGGPHLFAPGADLSSPRFELVTFEKGGWWRVILYGAALVLGLLPRLPGARHRFAERVEITGPGAIPVQVDGEMAGYLPARLAIDPVAVRVLYPRTD